MQLTALQEIIYMKMDSLILKHLFLLNQRPKVQEILLFHQE